MKENLFISNDTKDFWVWVNPTNFLVKHQIQEAGSFTSINSIKSIDKLMFIPNPNFEGFISPFQMNISTEYMVEYNLEKHREIYFNSYPSRVEAIYLFDSEEEANKYHEMHLDHVGGRILKKVKTNGSYIYSKHDSSWIDFLRLPHSIDNENIYNISNLYWGGEKVSDTRLESMGKEWTQDSIFEILFMGRVDFYDRSL